MEWKFSDAGIIDVDSMVVIVDHVDRYGVLTLFYPTELECCERNDL